MQLYSVAGDSKDPGSHVLDGQMPASNKHTQHPRRRHMATSMAEIKKKGHIRKNLTKMVNLRYIAGDVEEEGEPQGRQKKKKVNPREGRRRRR